MTSPTCRLHLNWLTHRQELLDIRLLSGHCGNWRQSTQLREITLREHRWYAFAAKSVNKLKFEMPSDQNPSAQPLFGISLAYIFISYRSIVLSFTPMHWIVLLHSPSFIFLCDAWRCVCKRSIERTFLFALKQPNAVCLASYLSRFEETRTWAFASPHVGRIESSSCQEQIKKHWNN